MSLISRTTIGIFLVLIAVLISMVSLSSYSLGIYTKDKASPEYLSASTFLTIGITLLLVSVAVLMGLVVLSSGASLDFHIEGNQYPAQAPVHTPAPAYAPEMQYREASIDGSNATINAEPPSMVSTITNMLSKTSPTETNIEKEQKVSVFKQIADLFEKKAEVATGEIILNNKADTLELLANK